MGVGEVQACARHLDQNLALARLGLGQVDDLEHLGAAELFDLHRSHAVGNLRTSASLREPMTLVAVGSIAFDAIKTPFGERDRALGGAAVHFALAASYFSDVRVVGPVGDDFGEAEYDVLRRHDVNTDDVEHVEGGKTFFYACEYEWNLNVRHSLDTQLNVFADFQPKLSQASKDAETLFLANIQPDLQREVREQCTGASLSGLDSMNFWIESARESLVRTIAMVDLVLMNDDEVRMLTEEPTLLKGARQLMDLGPSAVVVKQGEYGAALVTARRVLLAAGLPARDRDRSHRGGRLVRRRLPGLPRRPGRRHRRRHAAQGHDLRLGGRLLLGRGVRLRARRNASPVRRSTSATRRFAR